MMIDTNNRSGTVTHPAYGTRTVSFLGSRDVDHVNAGLAMVEPLVEDSTIITKEQ